jgi:hypothetical protein
MKQQDIEYLPVAALRPWPGNARTHSRKQVRQIADSIGRFGFTNPIVIDDQNHILAGHGRVAGARLLAMQDVPCLRVSGMSVEEKRAYVIADNKLALNAGWDEVILAEELKALHALAPDFDIGLTGFSLPEVDSLICTLKPEERKEELQDTSSGSPAPETHEVGYGKPPPQTRFAPGRSGNPRGRPRGSKNSPAAPGEMHERLKSIMLEEAYRPVSINEAGGQVSIPMAQAVIRSLAVNAAKGDVRAQRLFTELVATIEREERELRDECLAAAIEYKDEWEQELQQCEALKIEATAPLPHPDDVLIDVQSGTVSVKGPMTKEDKATWDRLSERKKECDTEIAELEKILREEPDCPHRQEILADIDRAKKVRARISAIIPDYPVAAPSPSGAIAQPIAPACGTPPRRPGVAPRPTIAGRERDWREWQHSSYQDRARQVGEDWARYVNYAKGFGDSEG